MIKICDIDAVIARLASNIFTDNIELPTENE
jgi:hypothetical protein